MSMRIHEDIRQYLHYSQAFMQGEGGVLRRLSVAATPSLQCVVLYRFAHWLHEKNLRPAARLVTRFNILLHHIYIDPSCDIGPGLYIPHPPGVHLQCHAGEKLTVYARAVAASMQDPDNGEVGTPRLGIGVTLGAFCVVIGDVKVGDAVVVGPSVSVTDDVDPGTVLHSTEQVTVVPAGSGMHA